MNAFSRRQFMQTTAALASVAALPALAPSGVGAAEDEAAIAFGLVTYMWGADWDLPTLLANCRKAEVLGVELRTTHAHAVEPKLDATERKEVASRFGDAGITCVGIGSNERFDSPDPAVLKKAIEASKDFIRLSHDIGGSGVKVKPDSWQPNVSHEKTIEQIGKSLNELGEYASGFGQQIRLEVHGKCQELPTIKAIMDVADDPNVAVCWNSNPTDLAGAGLEHNFKLVRNRLGATCHVRELNSTDYPFQKLLDLLVKTKYVGWVLLEANSKPADRVAALAEQKKLFAKMLSQAGG